MWIGDKKNRPVNNIFDAAWELQKKYLPVNGFLGGKQMLKDILQEQLDKRKRKWWEWHKKNPQVKELKL